MSAQKYTLVATDLAPVGDALANFYSVVEGEVAIFSETVAGVIAQLANGLTYAAYPKVHIVRGGDTDNGPQIVTIEGKGVKTWKSKAYAAGTKLKRVFGYDASAATTGQLAINVYNDMDYHLRIMDEDLDGNNDRWSPTGNLLSVSTGQATSSDSQGRYKILSDLVEQNQRDADRVVDIRLMHSEAATGAMDANAVVVKGSTSVGTATTTNPVVGDFLTLKGDLYKITAISAGASYTIDRPYEGESETITKGTTIASQAGYITNATVDDDTYFGLEIEAVNVDESFTISLEGGFDSGETETSTTAMVSSVGTYAEALQEEKEADALYGHVNKIWFEEEKTRYAASGSTYDVWTIVFDNYSQGTDGTNMVHNEPMELNLYLVAGSTVTDLYDYLNDWLLTTPHGAGAFSNV